MAEHQSYSLTPAHISDPYPERPDRHPGVRQTTDITVTGFGVTSGVNLTPTPTDPAFTDIEHVTDRYPQLTQTAFTASLKPDQTPAFTSPWASLLLALFGFAMLGLTAVTADVPPTVILGAWALWTVCSTVLVTAECAGIRSGSGGRTVRSGGLRC